MVNNFDVKNKTALVTGANRGIGEAYVLALINAGARKVYAAARDLDNLKPLLQKHPDTIQPILLDVTNAAQINSLVENVDSLDILINNAGIANACQSSSDNALEISRIEMETHFFGPLQITLALLAKLKQSKQAAIINVCSIAAISNFPVIGPYSISKAALHSFTQGLRAELASVNIRAVGVYPGPIDTRLAEGMEMDKPHPSQVAERTLDALNDGVNDVFPDDFSEHMYGEFLKHPRELEKVFAGML